ncbi:MAG: hypothetical protein HKN70_05325 [Gammaproteobacteria bacterium]|nr:hypothetical protein [Gammaproteobacteria bacterium]
MNKVVGTVMVGAMLMTPVAGAYSIKHSYSGGRDATEYHGMCANGDSMKVVQQANGSWIYEGPAGDGKVEGGSLDDVARKACGE